MNIDHAACIIYTVRIMYIILNLNYREIAKKKKKKPELFLLYLWDESIPVYIYKSCT